MLLLLRNLAQLDLEENDILDRGGQWLSCFPDTHTSLVSLNFATVNGAIDFEALERLVDRSKGLKSLKVPKDVSLEQLQRLLVRAPQLTELGTGSYSQILRWGQYAELTTAFNKCKGLRSMSGFWEVHPTYVPSLYSVCLNLTSLNLSDVMLHTTELSKLITYCHNLERLLVSVLVLSLHLRLSSFRDLHNCKLHMCLFCVVLLYLESSFPLSMDSFYCEVVLVSLI